MATKSIFDNYNVRKNTIDLTTIEVNGDNPAYLVDRKFMHLFVENLVPVNFEDFKKNLITKLSNAENIDNLCKVFDDSIYIEKIVSKIHELSKLVEEEKD
jgi:hypothetical protein